jgi:malate synthase
VKHGVTTDDGETITAERVVKTTSEELDVIRNEIGAERFQLGRFEQARALFLQVATDTSEFSEFLTLPAYPLLCGQPTLVPPSPHYAPPRH